MALAVPPSACWRVWGGHASGEEGAHGCAWTRTWEEGAAQALSLAERAAPSACVCVLRGGGVGVGHTQHREGALRGARGRGGMCAWVLGVGKAGACMNLQCCGFARRLRVWPGGSQHWWACGHQGRVLTVVALPSDPRCAASCACIGDMHWPCISDFDIFTSGESGPCSMKASSVIIW